MQCLQQHGRRRSGCRIRPTAAAATISSLFAITRQRGDGPTQVFTTVSGRQFAKRPDGQLTIAGLSYQEIPTETGARISISARTEKEALQLLKRAQSKYPQIDAAAIRGCTERSARRVGEEPRMVRRDTHRLAMNMDAMAKDGRLELV